MLRESVKSSAKHCLCRNAMNQKQIDLSFKKKKKGERKNKTRLKQGLEKKPKKLVSD